MSIPNWLSILRMAMIPAFAAVYLTASEQPWFIVAAGILLASGLTDVADGIIARRFGMETRLGRILDPLADKLTQITVALCLWLRFPQLWLLFVVLLGKELLQLTAGLALLRINRDMAGAKWFGKLYTVVFYLATLVLVAFPQMGGWLPGLLAGLVILAMLFALAMYIPVFLRLCRKGRAGRE